MSESLTLTGSLLAADPGARTLRGTLLPYGEPGRTNRGTVTCSAGAVTVPDDVTSVVLNLGHDRDRPAGRATTIVDTDAGLVAEFTVARVPAGDQLLAEAAEGLRNGLSVELDDIAIRAGRLVAGRLSDVGAVVRPAFPSALVAGDAGPDPDPEDDEAADATQDDEQTPAQDPGTPEPTQDRRTPQDDENDDQDQSDDQEETTVPTATAPRDLQAAGGRRAGLQASIDTPRDLFRLLAAAYDDGGPAQLTAALADVTVGANTTGIGARTTQPAWLGELWSGRAYNRRYVPLVTAGTLTGMKVAGWRWVDKPVVADYAGNKAAVPSNPVTVEPAEAAVTRVAGGWDVDRAFFDFGNADFLESFFRAMTESYAKISDARAAAAIIDAATANPTTPAAVPAGVSAAMAAIVDGALAILDEGLPSFALVARNLYREVLLTRSDDTLAYLNAALGLEDGTLAGFRVVPGGDELADDQVVVGAREAVTFYELAGTPIRVEAENIANGGRDVAVFGYTASIVNDGDAITLVDLTPGA